jgi:hypothetical protein
MQLYEEAYLCGWKLELGASCCGRILIWQQQCSTRVRVIRATQNVTLNWSLDTEIIRKIRKKYKTL